MRGWVFKELAALVAPPSCGICGASLLHGGEAMCSRCRAGLPWLPEKLCRRCGLPAPCSPCPAVGAAFEAAWAPMAYAGVARTAVTRLKFAGSLALADVMAAHVAANAPPALVAQVTLVPVPLHPSRRRARGYNQAEWLARALSARLGIPVARCLARRGDPSRQVGAGALVRRADGRLEISARGRAPDRALVVDDVCTTGATFDACARALRMAGSEAVACVAYARTLPGW